MLSAPEDVRREDDRSLLGSRARDVLLNEVHRELIGADTTENVHAHRGCTRRREDLRPTLQHRVAPLQKTRTRVNAADALGMIRDPRSADILMNAQYLIKTIKP